MAATKVTLSLNPYPNGVDTTNRHLILFGKAAIAASPLTYATGGIPLQWLSLPAQNSSLAGPIWADFKSVSGSGYTYRHNASTDKLQIFTVDATALSTELPLAELTNGVAIPAAVSADIIAFRAEFLKAI